MQELLTVAGDGGVVAPKGARALASIVEDNIVTTGDERPGNARADDARAADN
jgi:hypothetical protein